MADVWKPLHEVISVRGNTLFRYPDVEPHVVWFNRQEAIDSDAFSLDSTGNPIGPNSKKGNTQWAQFATSLIKTSKHCNNAEGYKVRLYCILHFFHALLLFENLSMNV